MRGKEDEHKKDIETTLKRGCVFESSKGRGVTDGALGTWEGWEESSNCEVMACIAASILASVPMMSMPLPLIRPRVANCTCRASAESRVSSRKKSSPEPCTERTGSVRVRQRIADSESALRMWPLSHFSTHTRSCHPSISMRLAWKEKSSVLSLSPKSLSRHSHFCCPCRSLVLAFARLDCES